MSKIQTILKNDIATSKMINGNFVNGEIIFGNKPYAWTTHASDDRKPGYCEVLGKSLGHELKVVHRLDNTTTGIIAFATTKESAHQLSDLFKNHEVEKTYWFLTASRSEQDTFEVHSRIEAQGKLMTSKVCSESEANSSTIFKRRKRSPFFELWEAYPKTGKTHQIRLHAANIGLPILGDSTYGGVNYPRLCLHAYSLKFPDQEVVISPAPVFFERMGLLKDEELISYLTYIDSRQRLFEFLKQSNESLRLLHTEISDIKMDLFGPHLWVYWYHDAQPSQKQLERLFFLGQLINRKVHVQWMLNRGTDPNQKQLWHLHEEVTTWQAIESQVKFEFRSHQGMSPGLFLDQRQNREWVLENSSQKSVLNLFAYTCGFSVFAALGKAKEVLSVDLSANFLDWGKKNFDLNHLNSPSYQFHKADSFFFLERAKLKNRYFDLIICDPPSFSRNKDGKVFRIEKDLQRLLQLCWDCLTDSGYLLFSTNYEGWDSAELENQIKKGLPKAKIRQNASPPDFDLPHKEPLLKSFLISKSSSR